MNLQRLLFLGVFGLLSSSSFGQCPPQSLPYSENFNSSLGCFTVIDGGTTVDTWIQAGPGGGSAGGDLDGTGLVLVDSDDAGTGNTLDETLTSPFIDASNLTGTLFLEFDHYFRSLNANDSGWVQVWDSLNWVTVYSTSTSIGGFGNPDQQQIDISSFANDSLQVRFRYVDNGSWAWYWLIDNFKVETVLCPSPTGLSVSSLSDTSFSIGLASSPDTLAFEWGPVGFTQGSGCIGTKAPNGSLNVSINNNDAGLCGNQLSSGQCYDVYIATSCPGGGYSSYVGPFTFCTVCTTVNLPFTENFNINIGCFNATDGGTSTDTWRSAPTGGGTSGGDLDGTAHMEVDSDDAGPGETLSELLTSPPINAGAIVGSLILEFDQYYNHIGADSAAVEVYDGSNWVTVYSAQSDIGGFNNPDHQNIDITAYANAALQVRFNYQDNGAWAWYWLIDNISVKEILCSPSVNFSAIYVGSDSVQLGWTPGTATGHIVEYGLSGFIPGSGMQIGTTAANLGINGLAINSSYDFYLIDTCIGNSYEDTLGPITASTACLAQTIPFTENFANGPGCFTIIDGGSSSDTWVHAPIGGVTSGGDVDGSPFMEVDSDGAGSGNSLRETLNSPILDASAYMSQGSLSLIFDQYYNHLSSDSGIVEVYDGSSWNQVAVFRQDLGAFGAPDSQNIDITAYANPNLQIRFVYDDNNSWAWYWLIDNFEVSGLPCGSVTSIDTISVGINNANLSWNSANGSLWNMNWGPQGFRQGTTSSGNYVNGLSSNSYNLTGLQAGTCYDVYVQDTCVGLGSGAWLGPYTVCTDTSCFRPNNLSVSGVGTSSASASWVGFSPSFQYSLVTSTSTSPANGSLSITNGLNASLTGLSPSSFYCIYVRSICAPGDTSAWSAPICFNTACTSYTAPYLEDFDGSTSACWQSVAVTGSNQWTVGTGSTGGSINASYSGTQNAVFTSGSGGPYVSQFVSPIIDASGLSSTELSFWYGQESWAGDQNSLNVYYRTSASGAWINLWSDVNSVSAWTKVTIAVPSNSSSLQFAFEGEDNWGRANVVDDIRVDVPGGSVICPQVNNVSSSNEDCNSVDLNWVSASGGSIIEYGPLGFTPGNGTFTNVVTSPYTITNLMASSSYDVYIADTCGIQDTGVFNGPTAVNTNANGVASAVFSASLNPSSILEYTFDASASSGSVQNYVWDFGDGNVGNGISTTHTYSSAGSYTIELILVSDCGNDTLSQTIADVSNPEIPLNSFKLYPNPAKEFVLLESDFNGAIEIRLSDASGREVKFWQTENKASEILSLDLNGINKGVYLMRITADGIQHQERLLID
jgi:hypothetical protein